ncbi:hypothetical protein FHS31_001393 [Sphingomonas vulcanisoli]|uniref:Uncharacterized protein n=1 Tax=Sphingomonas vulcanisoli TaxID=1658060 RepID=A0ABX0TQH9_9SPHN|nr:hypothetical protein [Sphingomonas vulcanisoli]NIJ07783.1 hypothetical protein [Sphingomonas vulcanisoli]
MRLILALLLTATPAIAQDEDAAHRADRERTQELNRRAAAVVERRNDSNAQGSAAYRAAHARYERDMAEWRRRVAACDRGDWSACE